MENLIAFLDSDDLWLDNKLSEQVRVLSNPDIDVAYTDVLYFSGEKII